MTHIVALHSPALFHTVLTLTALAWTGWVARRVRDKIGGQG